jgi:hypothetical protein
MTQVLKPWQVEQFVEEGYTLLKEAFSVETAAAVRAGVFRELGLKEDEPSGWTKGFISLQKDFEGAPYSQAYTPQVKGAFDQLMGAGRWVPWEGLGWWPVTFPGFHSGPWKPGGWHVDGQHFQHRVDSPDQGLLPLFIFSEIQPGWGGTAVVPGSHRWVARRLKAAGPEGMDPHVLAKECEALPKPRVMEATGLPGDVLLLHPMIIHAGSSNNGKTPRVACNPCFGLKEPMNLSRANPAGYSPVERAIVEAIKG